MMSALEQKPVKARFDLAAPRKARTVPDALMFGAIAFVPFQQALTFDLGFPLKISELLAILAVVGYILDGQSPRHRAVGFGLFIALGLIIEFSTVVNLIWAPVTTQAPGYTGGLTFDLLLYAVYGIFVLVTAWFCATRLGAERIGKAFGIAVRLAAIYCVAQIILHLAGLDEALALVNGVTQVGTAYGVSFPRNGPFLEGNYLGFFAGAAIFISARRRDAVGVAAGIFCVLYSQSTVGLLATAAAALAILVLRPNARAVTVFAFLGAAGVAAVAFIPRVSDFVLQQLAKIGFAESERESVGYSLRSRSRATDTGIDMGLDHPWFGVGSGRYGFWHKDYVDYSEMPLGFTSGAVRPIANNSYVQIFAELGVFAAIVFVCLLVVLFVALIRKNPIDVALAVFLVIGLSATPAWTALPIWFTIAYLISAARRAESASDQSSVMSPSSNAAGSSQTPGERQGATEGAERSGDDGQ